MNERIRQYTLYKNGVEQFTTKDEKLIEAATNGYTKLPPYGNDRLNLYPRFIESVDRIKVISFGNYTGMFTYITEFFK